MSRPSVLPACGLEPAVQRILFDEMSAGPTIAMLGSSGWRMATRPGALYLDAMHLQPIQIPLDQQLDAYTNWKIRELFERHGVIINENCLLTSDGRDVRRLFTFTRRQLVDYLRDHPDRPSSYIEQARAWRGIYDKDILEREGSQYVLYSQDHGRRRSERFYRDLFEAAADWLMVQYGIWLDENGA